VPDRTYTISQLAAEFDVTPRAIRYYEDRGLLSPTRSGQNRIYLNRDRCRLYLILRGKRVGFSLSEIQEMLDQYDPNNGHVGQMHLVFDKVHQRISDLERQKQDIEQIISELRRDSRKIEGHLAEKSSSTKIEMPTFDESDDTYTPLSATGAE